jgi:hypothetical protein
VASSPIANMHSIEVWTFVQSSLDEFLSSSSAATSSSDTEANASSRLVVMATRWFYRRLVADSFLWLSEGAYGDNRGLVPKHTGQTRYKILTLNRGASDVRANAT